jgi:hypothetical protein
MEMSQGKSFVAILNKNVIFFFFYKIGEQEGRIGPAWGWSWYQWEGRRQGNGVGG